MSKKHLKNINAPRTWPIERKKKVWITRPNSGNHSLKDSMPLSVIFIDILGYAKTSREIKKILALGEIKVNGKVRKDRKFPVGIFDVIELPEENYRLLYNNRGKFYLDKIDKKDTLVLYQVYNKTILGKNKVQLNFSTGENLITDNKEIKTGDSVIIKDKKIKEVLKFEKGAPIYLTGGKHVGMVGKIDTFDSNKVIFADGKEKYQTMKKYGFVIGKDKPMINIKTK